MEENSTRFFADLLRDFEGAKRNIFNEDLNILQGYLNKMSQYCQTILIFINAFTGTELEILLNELQDLIAQLYNDLKQKIDICVQTTSESNMISLSTLRHGSIGRPQYHVTNEQFTFLRKLGLNWSKIGQTLNMSRVTIYRHRCLLNYNDRNRIESDYELDNILTSILTEFPNAGESMIIGALRTRNLYAPRWKIRERLRLLDAVGRELRRRRVIQRRVYRVKGPNYLWHIDSNHKLVNFRFIIHGCIDGYSRLIIYLECLQDNKANSVHKLFVNGVRKYNIPHRVRGDHGTENIQVARFMLQNRGLNRGSFMTGRSVHNQRIERLWNDVNRLVTRDFKQIFLFMGNTGILNEMDECDMFCLSYIFLPRIRKRLNEFMNNWNNHTLRSENNNSPIALWTLGMMQCNEIDDLPLHSTRDDTSLASLDNLETFPQIETNNHVTVPEIYFNLSDSERITISETVPNPLEEDGCGGIKLYLLVREIVKNFVNNTN